MKILTLGPNKIRVTKPTKFMFEIPSDSSIVRCIVTRETVCGEGEVIIERSRCGLRP